MTKIVTSVPETCPRVGLLFHVIPDIQLSALSACYCIIHYMLLGIKGTYKFCNVSISSSNNVSLAALTATSEICLASCCSKSLCDNSRLWFKS